MLKQFKSINNRFGEYGGCYIPEILNAPISELKQAFTHACSDENFTNTLLDTLKNYTGRPTPLTYAKQLSQRFNNTQIYLKREDLCHTGAHKINNALGQCLLAKSLGKTRIIAETGAGQHGVATAAACAHLGLSCCVYMGAKDAERQLTNVQRMRLLGAQVITVSESCATLRAAVNAALRDWSATYENSHYCIGSIVGPAPFPEMVSYFQSIIGMETKQQCVEMLGRLPDAIIACIGGGSNAMGIFSAFLEDKVSLYGIEAGGVGCKPTQHANRNGKGTPGVLHGCYSNLLQDQHGQIQQTHSISAGLDYPLIGPQHAYLQQIGRVQYASVNDQQALSALRRLARMEGIIAALESSHALSYLLHNPNKFENKIVVINISGRGDKDLAQINVLDKNYGSINDTR